MEFRGFVGAKGLLTICGDVAIRLDSDVNILEPSNSILAKDEIAA